MFQLYYYLSKSVTDPLNFQKKKIKKKDLFNFIAILVFKNCSYSMISVYYINYIFQF